MNDLLVASIKDAISEQWQHYADPMPVTEDRPVRLADEMAGTEVWCEEKFGT